MQQPDDVIFIHTDAGDRPLEEVDAAYISSCDDLKELFELMNSFVLRRDLIADQLDAAKEFGGRQEDWFRRARSAYNFTREGIRRTKFRIDQLKGRTEGSEIELLKKRIRVLDGLLKTALEDQSQATKRAALEYSKSVDRQFIDKARVILGVDVCRQIHKEIEDAQKD